MSKSTSTVYKPPIYPAYAFRASPTYFTWVKLTAADIHALRNEPGYEGQNLYFHLNHPIRFIGLTAPIISIEDLFSKFCLLTLDDGSGATISVKITRLSKEVLEKHAVELSSNTTVSNVNIPTAPETCWDFRVEIDGEALDIGTVVKVKGTIDDFRGTKQIDLKRIKIVRGTAEEIREWQDLARWKSDVLSRPWYLGKRKLKELEEKEEREARHRAEEERKKEDRRVSRALKRARREEKIRRYEEKKEMKRIKEELMFNAGALI